MGNRSSTKIARYARMCFSSLHVTNVTNAVTRLILCVCRKKGPVFAIVHHNSTLRRHIESAHDVRRPVFDATCQIF